MPAFEKLGMFYLGKQYDEKTGILKDENLLYNSKNFTTHAICLGMTGSGKTGLGITIIEEAALDSIPSVIIDPKGDIGNILLTFPNLSAEEFKPWIDQGEAERKGESLEDYAKTVAETWKNGLKDWGETGQRIQDLRNAAVMEIYTPASKAGLPLSILSSFKAPPQEFLLDAEGMRDRVLSTASGILGLLGIHADPLKSREHILIATIIDYSWRAGKDLDLPSLIQQVQKPPFDKVGILDLDTFFPLKERVSLSVSLNNLLASPGFQAWMEGVPLDIQQLLYTKDLKPKVSVISIAHLTDPERMFFVTLFLNQLIAWMRKQPGTSSLRALFYMDEIFGYFPPSASPPSKMPMITLLKQARAFGLGMVLCTQNPVDLDYKGLSNCGTWFIGRLQTARDKARVIEGLAAASNGEINAKKLDQLMSNMGSRVFIMRSIYEKEPILFQTRWTLSYLRGPLTLTQIEMLTRNQQKDFVSTPEPSSTISSATGNKPVVLGNVPEYFVLSTGLATPVEYRPFLAGFAKLHFVEKKYNIDDWMTICRVAEPPAEGKMVDWGSAENHPDLKQQLATTPAAQASYRELPEVLLQEKNYSVFKKEFSDYLYQNETVKLFQFKELNLISGLQESEADFRQRIFQILRENRDASVQKLRDQYAKKLDILKERIRKAEEKKTTQQKRSFYQIFEFVISTITTIIGAMLGKKITKTTINQAGTTFKRIGRVGKENQDVAAADENLQTLQQQLKDTETQLDSEIANIPVADSAKDLPLEELMIRPRKTDISVDPIALIWWP